MTFSVLQSVYSGDTPAFLDEALKSIADNTLLPERVVLVKNGDLTPELDAVIDSWRDRLPLYVVGYEKNRRLAYALNFGLQFVETDLVARMDSDDVCFPDRFEKQIAQFEADPTLKVLGAGIEEFYADSSGREFRKVRLYPKHISKSSKALYRGNPLAHPTVMLYASILKEFKYSDKINCYEDLDLWLRLLGAGLKIMTLQEPLLHYRITDGTFRRRSASKGIYEYSIFAKALRKFNGRSWRDAFLLLRVASRFLPRALNRRLYLSQMRQNFFKERLMSIKYLSGQLFVQNGHLFEALIQFEENGMQVIKAVQLDSASRCLVEVPAENVTLVQMASSASIDLNISLNDGGGA